MRLRAENKAGSTLFFDTDADYREVYILSESGGSVPDDMREIVTEFELVGEVMHADVADGAGWNSPMVERLERRRNELKAKLMDMHIREKQNEE